MTPKQQYEAIAKKILARRRVTNTNVIAGAGGIKYKDMSIKELQMQCEDREDIKYKKRDNRTILLSKLES